MPPIDAVIEKVAKLRRLATSNNANEAAAAAAAAAKLMQEHGIAEAQLEAAGEAKKEEPIDAGRENPVAQWVGRRTPQWAVELAGSLVRHYDCSSYIEEFERNLGNFKFVRVQRIRAFGRPSDLESVRYMYAWLSVEIERLASLNAGNGRAWLNSFRVGAVRGCINEMYKAKREAREAAEAAMPIATVNPVAAANASAALVLLDTRAAEAKELRDKVAGKLYSTGSYRGASSSNGYSAGKEAGASLGRQSKGLSGGGSKQLGK